MKLISPSLSIREHLNHELHTIISKYVFVSKLNFLVNEKFQLIC